MALIEKLNSIGEAIRAKTGKTELMTLDEMPTEIAAIETGGGEIPEEAFLFTGDCQYTFANNKWTWFIDMYGDKITTKDLTVCQYLFSNSNKLEEIPFDINLAATGVSGTTLIAVFQTCKKLREVPAIKGNLNPPTSNYSNNIGFLSMFNYCENLREIPYNYFDGFAGDDYWVAAQKYTGGRGMLFANCTSLRELPDISKIWTIGTSSSSIYYSLATYCYALNEIKELPVVVGAAMTSNLFNDTVRNCCRLKNFTFATQADGTPYEAQWKNQTIDLSQYVGYVNYDSYILNYNSGITADKCVSNDENYLALKDDPDWYTKNLAYCRYNHDSAVATINSLPDTSSYIRGNGGTNTIKFKSQAGASTDGGAIAALTEEEIAVATAKGWTVTLAV